jgi:hypothetical protein
VQRRVIQLFLKLEGILGFSPSSDMVFPEELNYLTKKVVSRKR